jgi:hypothetical protein
MEATLAAIQLSLSQAPEPVAIMLWGLVLILMSVRIRSSATMQRNQVVEKPQATARSVAA